MICRKCGNEMKDEYHYLFCTQCGARLDEAYGEDNSSEYQEVGTDVEGILPEQELPRKETIPTAVPPEIEAPTESKRRVRLLAAVGILACVAVLAYVFRNDIKTMFSAHTGQNGGASQEIPYGETDLTPDDEGSSEAMTEAPTEMPPESQQTDPEAPAGSDPSTSQSTFFDTLIDSMSQGLNGEQVTGYFITAGTLNVRKSPGTDAEVLTKLSQNDFCLGTGNKNEDGSWVEVSCEGGSVVGWISQEYTENYSGTIDQVRMWAMEKYMNMQ